MFGEETGMEKLGWWPMEGLEVFGGSGGTKLPFDKRWLGGQRLRHTEGWTGSESFAC